MESLLYDTVHDLGRGNGSRSIYTHAAGVRTDVTFTDTFVILSSGEGDDSISVREREDRNFGASEELFNNDLVA